jgi:hypothetical protein
MTTTGKRKFHFDMGFSLASPVEIKDWKDETSSFLPIFLPVPFLCNPFSILEEKRKSIT